MRINRSNSEIWPDRIYIHDGDEEFNQYLQNYDERTYSEIDDFTIFAIVQEKYAGRPKRSRQEYRKMLEAAVKKYDCGIAKVIYFDISGDEIDDGTDSMTIWFSSLILALSRLTRMLRRKS